MKRFLVMLTFFTRIPINIKDEVTYDDYVKGVWFLPIISLLIGSLVYGLSLLFGVVNERIVAFIVLAFYLYLTGGLHIDGMADTMDAVGSNRSKERMLEIMKDSRIGTFGVLSIVVYVAGMFIAIDSSAWILCLLFPIVGRNAALLIGSRFKYARENGMGKSFTDGANIKIFILGTVIFVLLIILFVGGTIKQVVVLLAYIFTLIAISIIVKSIAKKIGGITGDVIGFTIEISQLMFLYAYVIGYDLAKVVMYL